MAKIEKGKELKSFNTYHVGGKADFFVAAKARQDLIDAYNFAKEKQIPYAVLGKGSNVLIADDGFRGLVIANKVNTLERHENKIVASSGLSLSAFVKYSAEAGLAGAEFLAGIPGTVGGAILGNAGAWGRSFGDIVESVDFLDESGARRIQREGVDFSYRESSFKKMKGIILGAVIVLEKSGSQEVEGKVKEILLHRSGKHPAGRSCGSFFKNIEVKYLPRETLEAIGGWEKGGRITAGKLIEEAGCRKLSVGGAEVSKDHANFLLNTGNATANDIKELAEQVKKKVYDKFGVELEPEVRYL